MEHITVCVRKRFVSGTYRGMTITDTVTDCSRATAETWKRNIGTRVDCTPTSSFIVDDVFILDHEREHANA